MNMRTKAEDKVTITKELNICDSDQWVAAVTPRDQVTPVVMFNLCIISNQLPPLCIRFQVSLSPGDGHCDGDVI